MKAAVEHIAAGTMRVLRCPAAAGLLVLAMALAAAWGIREVGAWVVPWISPRGAMGTYFAGEAEDVALAKRPFTELRASFHHRPARGVPEDGFYLRVEGWLWVPESREYAFASRSDDGLRMYLDGHPVLDNWRQQEWLHSNARGSRYLEKGWHSVKLHFYDHRGFAGFRVDWFGGPIAANTPIGGRYLWKVRVPWKN